LDLSFLLVADHANVSADGKLNILGVFSNITAVQFPTVHPSLSLVIQFTARPAEYGRQFTLQVKLIDEDGQSGPVNISGNAVVPQAGNGQDAVLPFVFNLQQVTFPKPGTYEFSILVDNDVKGAVPIHLMQAQPPPVNPAQS
jgi:hypothetical protein